jgi:hypothetical protein
MDQAATGEPKPYQSGFDDWDRRAWVRAKPHRDAPFVPELLYFSPELSVLLRHEEVQAAPEAVRRTLLVHCLYDYLEFTVRLEVGPVNEVCLLLRSPTFLPWLPAGMKDDALRIYTEEAGHAEMSHALMSAVRATTGVAPIAGEPRFLRELDRLYAAESPAFRPLVKLFFVVVSETLITGTLTRLPHDRRVQHAVRDLARDHAADEGRHHAYFRQLFEYLWPRLPLPLRRKVGVLLPEMILAFLAPDVPSLADRLAATAAFDDPHRIAVEAVACARTREEIALGARPTLRMLASERVFDDPVIVDAFRTNNLPVRDQATTSAISPVPLPPSSTGTWDGLGDVVA